MPHATDPTTPLPRTPSRVELINLRTKVVMPLTGQDGTAQKTASQPVIACETMEQPKGPPLRTYRWTGSTNEYWPSTRPVLLYFRTAGPEEPRFDVDISDDASNEYSYAGWLPLGLITHPDGRSVHQACTNGDVWVTDKTPHSWSAPANRTLEAATTGPRTTSATAAMCMAELRARTSLKLWNQHPPTSWPPDIEARARMREHTAYRLATTAAALVYELRVERNHREAARHSSATPGNAKANSPKMAEQLRSIIKITQHMRLLHYDNPDPEGAHTLGPRTNAPC